MENYIITSKTLAIVGLTRRSCKVIEENCIFIIEKCWQDVLNESCLYYSSSLQGRVEGSRAILNKEYKVPIILQEANELVYFPVGNHTDYKCCWISLKSMENYVVYPDQIQIIFRENRELIVVSGKKAFESQLLKAYSLEKVLISRHEKLKNSDF